MAALLQKFRLGVPIRDMRLLDPNLLTSETGKILVRPQGTVYPCRAVEEGVGIDKAFK